MKAYLLLFLLPLWSIGLARAQDDVEDYVAHPVTDSIYVLHVPDNSLYDNIVVRVGDEALLMIDDGFMETLGSVRAALRRLGGHPVRYVVNTHFHHAGANEAFGETATIIAHHTVRERMQREVHMYGTMPIGPWPAVALPDVTFDSTLTLHFGEEKIRLLHFPHAHTDGDIVAWLTKANVVVTGDLFVPSLGVCDLANGGTWDAFLAATRRLLDLVPPDALIIPGHGPVSTYADLEEVYAMLTDVTAHVTRQIEAGHTLDQVIEEGLPAQWQSWPERGLSAEFFLTNVYEGLTK